MKKEGLNSVQCLLRNDLATAYYDNGGGGSAIDLTGEHVRAWFNFASLGNLDTEANNGIEFFMFDGTNTAYWVILGSDTYNGGWFNTVIDCDSTPDSGSYDKTSVQRWGFRFNRTTAPRNVDNTWIDYIRYGDGYHADGGTSGDRVTLDDIAAADLTNGYGILEKFEGVFFCYGRIQINHTFETTYFEMNGEVLVFADKEVSATLYELATLGPTYGDIQNSVFKKAGTVNRFDLSLNGLSSASPKSVFNNNLVQGAGAIDLSALDLEATGNTFDDCGQITPSTSAGADLTNNIIKNCYVASALLWNGTTDPQGKIDGCQFISAGTGHAIELGTSCPSTITLVNITAEGYASSNGSTGNEVIYNNSGKAITINLTGGGSGVSVMTYRNGTGASTTVQASFTLTLTGVPSNVQVTIVNSSTRTELQNSTSTGADITYTHGGGETVDILFMGLDYDPNVSDIFSLTLPSSDSSIPISMIDDLNYENP